MIKKIIGLLKRPALIFNVMGNRGLFNWMDDQTYLKALYRVKMGKKLNISNPQTFNEKIQWLKLHDRKSIYTQMVDKYEAKKFVSSIIGDEYIIPTLGVWNNFNDIDFNKLPDQFVLKCTHDSGGLAICRDKNTFNYMNAKKKINKSLRKNFYWAQREWPYKNVVPQIIAEKYMEDTSHDRRELMDYKFYCFNGQPRFLYISVGLEDHSTASISFVSLDWKFEPFRRIDYKGFEELPPKPEHFDKMLEISKKLSKGTKFLRVDLYEINGHIYFSELTFSPNSGFMKFIPEKYDYEIGKMLNLGSDCEITDEELL